MDTADTVYVNPRVQGEDLQNVLGVLSTNYNAVYMFNLDTAEGTVVKLSTGSKNDVGKILEEGVSVSQLRALFGTMLVHPEDRPAFMQLMDVENARLLLAHEKSYSLIFRRAQGFTYQYLRMIVAKTEEKDERPVHLVAGFENVDEQIRTITEQKAIIEGLMQDFDCVLYVTLKEKKVDDTTREYRTSDRILRCVPGWAEEKNFHNRLNLMMEYFVAPEDRDEFFRLTRREVVLSVISKEKAHFVNFRTVLEGDEYYQIKFTGDRDSSGNLVGMTLGFHSIDEETRREISLRKKVEKLVEKRTAELRKKNRTLRTINNGIIDTIGALVESRDEDSGMHIMRVKGYTVILARSVMCEYPEYGLNERKIALIGAASALHDVGKLAIPDAILRKPGRLTAEEFEIMKTHSAKGCEIIENLTPYWDREYLTVSKEICRHHHEKWDGRGYPDGLKGDAIPISAQIVSVADVFDALTTKRVYKDAYPISTAFDMIIGGECGEFSDRLMRCLNMCREEFELQAKSEKLETGSGGDLAAVKAFDGLDPEEDEE